MIHVLLLSWGLMLLPIRPDLPEPFANVDRTDIRELILEMAQASLAERYDPEQVRFNLQARWIPGQLTRKSPDQILSVDPVGRVERYTTFEVSCLEGSRKNLVQIQLAVEMEQRVPVAVRRIPAGETLDPGDLDIRWVSVATLDSRLVRHPEELDGKRLRRTLAPGEAVREVDIAGDDLIESGDPVTLIFERHGIRVELEAEARQSGAVDEEIRLYSSETRKRYIGRIVRPGVAIWQQTL